MSKSENYPLDDFGLKMMTEVRRLSNLVEALQKRVNKQDEAIGKIGLKVKNIEDENTARRNSEY